MCLDLRGLRVGDPVTWVDPADGRRFGATIRGLEPVFGATTERTDPSAEVTGPEVWPAFANAERLIEIQVEGERSTRVVPLSQLCHARERER